ncbi:alpha/beta hydrolase [Companilactobacillus metriopterae]|uniref:alpha/beta hydrolase n=1 Tax=Companilactobacillus metriopterae TaxID=1909267 RepID=UPI00100B5479|nr:CocE/NonD family hydrolase [Companilactobacillus metriopterae]
MKKRKFVPSLILASILIAPVTTTVVSADVDSDTSNYQTSDVVSEQDLSDENSLYVLNSEKNILNSDNDSESQNLNENTSSDITSNDNSEVSNINNENNISSSENDTISISDINQKGSTTHKTIIGKINGFINDRITDVTTGTVAAISYPFLFGKHGTQVLSDVRTFINPNRYDVENTWNVLDQKYNPEASQEFYTNAQDWWDNQAVKETMEVPFYNDSSKNIRATYVANNASKKTVIIGQGWTERPDWIGVVSKVWYDMGYNVLMPSQRGQFSSDGNLLSFGYQDKNDWKTLVSKVNEMNGEDGEIVFYGQSLGANTALEAASEPDLAKNVKAVIADAGYSTLPSLGNSLYGKTLNSLNGVTGKLLIPINFSSLPFLPYEKIVKNVDKINQFLQGFSLDDVSGLAAAAKTTIPSYFITTEDDGFIPDTQTVAMFDASKASLKSLWVLTGSVGGHASANNAVGDYQKNIQGFLDQINKVNNLSQSNELSVA